MPAQHDPDRGLYLLHLRLVRPLVCIVGRLGRFEFPSGAYVYVGSAQRALTARVLRHLRPAKAVRWHVDRLTTAEACQGRGAWLLPGATVGECALNRWVGALPGAATPVRGFGASDCRSGCPAHLWVWPTSVAGPCIAADLQQWAGTAVLPADGSRIGHG